MVVVGAGFAGLSAALHLRGAGRSVTVVEAATTPGGCARGAALAGHPIDTGPTVITMTETIDTAMGAVGSTLAEHVRLRRLDPVYRAEFADGTGLCVSTDVDATASRIADLAGAREADGYRRLVRHLGRLYRAERDSFIDRNIDGVGELVRPDLARVVALGGLRSVHGLIARYLRDERVRRVFTFQSLYAGVSPWRARAAYAVIAYLDTVGGAVYPEGGVRALPAAMAAVAARAGVTVRYGAPVVRVRMSADRARGVELASGETIRADAVVLALDAPRGCAELLGRPAGRVHASPSCVLVRLVRREPAPLPHHVVSFGNAWRSTFADLTRHGRLMRDPSLLVTTPPDGAAQAVLAPAPNLDRAPAIDWAAIGPRYRDELLCTLAGRGLELHDGIEAAQIVTPLDWKRYGHTAGTPFGAAHTLRQTGPWRLPNLVPGLANVVLAGAWTTPGVGVPMAVISGRLAAERITG